MSATHMCFCPAGHELKLWVARAGACDVCRRFVSDGEQVMDCRACNWYVCEDCRPNAGAQALSLWDSMQNLLFGDACLADPRGSVEATELVVDGGAAPVTPTVGTTRAQKRQPPRQEPSEPPRPFAEKPLETRVVSLDDCATLSPPASPGEDGEDSAEDDREAPAQAPCEKAAAASRAAATQLPDLLVREMTDLLDVHAEPEVLGAKEKPVDPFDLSSVQFDVVASVAAEPAAVGGA